MKAGRRSIIDAELDEKLLSNKVAQFIKTYNSEMAFGGNSVVVDGNRRPTEKFAIARLDSAQHSVYDLAMSIGARNTTSVS